MDSLLGTRTRGDRVCVGVWGKCGMSRSSSLYAARERLLKPWDSFVWLRSQSLEWVDELLSWNPKISPLIALIVLICRFLAERMAEKGRAVVTTAALLKVLLAGKRNLALNGAAAELRAYMRSGVS